VIRLLERVDVIDPYTVALHLKEPFGSFPINLVTGIVQAGSGSANSRAPIGTGPYKLVSQHVSYVPLWYKTNVAVFRPDIHGVRLSPIADFTFLKDVYRR